MSYRVGLWATAALGGAALALGLGWPAAAKRDSPRARAEALHTEALRRLEVHDLPGAVTALASAIQADSSYLPAVLDVLTPSVFGVPDVYPLLDSLLLRVAADPGHPHALCARVLTEAVVRHREIRPDPRYPEGHGCARLATLLTREFGLRPAERAAGWNVLAREFPEAVMPSLRAVGEWTGARDGDGMAAAASLVVRSRHRLVRVYARALLATALHGLGRHREAVMEEARGLSEAAGKEGLEVLRAMALANHVVLKPDLRDSALARHKDSLVSAGETVFLSRARASGPWERLMLLHEGMRRFLNNGDLTACIALGDSALALADSLGDPRGQAETHLLLGRAAVKAGEPARAEGDLLAAQAYGLVAGSLRLRYEATHNLLHLYEGTGRDAEARRAGAEFVELTELAVLTPVRMMSHRDFGVFLRRRGEWEEAQGHFERMVQLVDTLWVSGSDYTYYAGEYFESIGDLDRASAYYHRAVSDEDMGRVIEALTRIAEATSDTAAALAQAERFDQLRHKRFPEHRPLLPGVLARLRRFPEAAEKLDVARGAAVERRQLAGWSKLTLELAQVEYQRGDFARAAALGDSAARAAESVAEREAVVHAGALAAAALVRAGRADFAESWSRLARLRRDGKRMRLPSLDFDLALLAGEAALEAGELEPALNALRSAQQLADSLAKGSIHDPAQAGLRAARSTPSDRVLTFAVTRPKHPAALDLWAEWSWRRKARWAGSASPTIASLRRFAAEMPIVDYVVLDSIMAALVVTNRGASIQILPMTAAEAGTALASLYAAITPGVGSQLDRTRARVDPAILRRLAVGLFEPLVPHLGGEQALAIVPDGILHLVPFDALLISQAGSTVPALERFTMLRLPALGATSFARRPLPPGMIVALEAGDSSSPVPGAKQEVESVRAAVSRRAVRLLSGQEATEDGLRALVPGATIVHLAAHARPNVLHPDLAEVRLAPDSVHDGRLQAHEIRRLSLSGSLVILSACETGAGRVLRGEGPLSLSRAFLQAGAGAVVATLWPVGESAADLMAEFHRLLDRGLAPAEALRHAKQTVRAQGADPLEWAPFTLLARTR